MILDYSSRKIRDVAAKSTKLEQINEIPIFNFYRRKGPADIRTPDFIVQKRQRYL